MKAIPFFTASSQLVFIVDKLKGLHSILSYDPLHFSRFTNNFITIDINNFICYTEVFQDSALNNRLCNISISNSSPLLSVEAFLDKTSKSLFEDFMT